MNSREVVTAKMRRSGTPPGRPPEPDPYRPISTRAHVEPEGWKPPKRRPLRIPDVTLLVSTVADPVRPGEPLRAAAWATVLTATGQWLDWGILWGEQLDQAHIDAIHREASRLSAPHIGPQRDFGDFLLHRVVYQRRAALATGDLGVELGRLALGWGTAVTEPYRGGFSLIFSTKRRPHQPPAPAAERRSRRRVPATNQHPRP